MSGQGLTASPEDQFPSKGVDTKPNALVWTFIGLQILGGQIGLPIVVLTILLSKRVIRHPTFINFCLGWTISSICYVLLTYAGQQFGPQPSFNLCVTQAALIYAAPPLTATTSCILVLQMWFACKGTPDTIKAQSHKQIREVLFLILPYIVFFAFVTSSILVGVNLPHLVERSNSGMYCIIKTNVVGDVSALFAMLTTGVAIVFEGLIAVRLRRNWLTFRRGGVSGINFPFLIRCGSFTVVAVMAVCVCLVFIAHLPSPTPNLFLACVPVAAWLIFGSQSDIIRVWCFWKAAPQRSASVSSIATTTSSIIKNGAYDR